MKLQFKFCQEAPLAEREALTKALGDRGAAAVRRLFPAEKDPELAGLFIVEAETDSTAIRLLDLLRASPAVDFAEFEVSRRAARGKLGKNAQRTHGQQRS